MIASLLKRTPAERFAVGIGVFYVLLAVIGFTVTGVNGDTVFRGDPQMSLFGFLTLNGFHNIFHLAVGALLLGAVGIARAAGRPDLLSGALIGLGAFDVVATLIGVTGAFVNFADIPEGVRGISDNLVHLTTGVLFFSLGFAAASKNRVQARNHHL